MISVSLVPTSGLRPGTENSVEDISTCLGGVYTIVGRLCVCACVCTGEGIIIKRAKNNNMIKLVTIKDNF